jgi:hypothetical protein
MRTDGASAVGHRHIGDDARVSHEDRGRSAHQTPDGVDDLVVTVDDIGARHQGTVFHMERFAFIQQHIPGDPHVGIDALDRGLPSVAMQDESGQHGD